MIQEPLASTLKGKIANGLAFEVGLWLSAFVVLVCVLAWLLERAWVHLDICLWQDGVQVSWDFERAIWLTYRWPFVKVGHIG